MPKPMRRGQKFAPTHYLLPLVDEYVAWRTGRGRKMHAGNRTVLRRFANEWDTETRNHAPTRLIDNIDGDWVEDYFLGTYGENAPTTKRAYHNVIKVFIEWLIRYGVDPDAAKFDPGYTAGYSERPKLFLSADQLTAMWEGETEPYWRFMVAFLSLTACRINEARRARYGDIVTGETRKGDRRFWNIYRTKTHSKGHLMLLGDQLEKELDRYLMWYRANTGRDMELDDYLFPALTNNQIGKHLTITDPKSPRGDFTHRKMREIILKNVPEDTDPELLIGIGCHTFRRSGALAFYMRMLSKGIAAAKELTQHKLGHKKVTTTETYLNIDTFKAMLNDAILDYDIMDDGPVAEVVPLRLVRES